jgi:uncharacterized cofD-like protein
MINRYKVRRMLAPTAGLWKPVAIAVFGFLCFLLGLALTFRDFIQKPLAKLETAASRILQYMVPEDSLAFATWFLGGAFLLLGTGLLFYGARQTIRRMLEAIEPGLKFGFTDEYVRRQKLAQGPRIVAIGGGTGLSTLLRGLKQHSSNITAIVTVTDDGGSSGRLVQDKGMIPPGDIRNCLVALADAEKSMTDLFQHRFKKDSGSLSGHSMGNLLIAALVDQAHGDFEKAIEIASDVLAIRGRVVPSTLSHVRLRALLDNGVEICGETAIVEAGQRIRKIFLDPANVEPYQPALQAIRDADIICLGPGSVYTSIIPNLLVPGIAQALRDAKVPKVYVCNVMTQPGESDTFSASEHVSAVLMNTEARIFDYVLLNTGIPSESAIEKYREVGQHLVEADIDRVRAMGFRPLAGNFMSESDFVRHDPLRVAARIAALVGR